jgi:hypothetical protein
MKQWFNAVGLRQTFYRYVMHAAKIKMGQGTRYKEEERHKAQERFKIQGSRGEDDSRASDLPPKCFLPRRGNGSVATGEK